MQKLALLTVAGLACSAFGQVVVVGADGLAKAIPGDRTAPVQQSSTSTAGFNLSASKNFPGAGHVEAGVSWSFANWRLWGSFSAQSYAQSQAAAGSALAHSLVTLNVGEDVDVEYSGGTTDNSVSGTVSMVLQNAATNAFVVGGNFPFTAHVLPGQYEMIVDTSVPFGSTNGSYSIQFRPGNNHAQNARVIGNGTFTGSTSYATADGQTNCGLSSDSPSVWYRYDAPRAGSVVISTCGSGFDTALAVFETTNWADALSTIYQAACNDDAPAGAECASTRQSSIRLDVFAQHSYFIRVSGYNGAAGNYVLNVGPTNDTCEDAIQVGAGTYTFDNTLANTDGPILNSCVSAGDTQVNSDLWYVYTPLQSGFLTTDTFTSTFDTKLAIYQGAPCAGGSVYLACNDDTAGLQSKIENLPVVAGQDYYIRVGGFKANRGAGTLHVAFERSCPADFDGDGTVDFFDYDAFVVCFEGGTCPPGKTADFDGDGTVDFFDYDAFVVAFEGEC